MTDAVRSALEEARQAIADAPQDAWGFVEDRDGHGQPIVWPIKDELLSKIDAALAAPPAGGMAASHIAADLRDGVNKLRAVAAAHPGAVELLPLLAPALDHMQAVAGYQELLVANAASPQPPVASPVAWDDHLDDIETAIADSIDVDWQPRHAARDVVKLLKAKGPLYTIPPPAPGWNEALEVAAKAVMELPSTKTREIARESNSDWGEGTYLTFKESVPPTREEYAAAIRAALTPPATGAQDAEKVEEREVLLDTLATLVAAVSLLERSSKTAAPSNKMFDQMLRDYRASIKRARDHLKREG